MRFSLIPGEGSGLLRHDIVGVEMIRRFCRGFIKVSAGGLKEYVHCVVCKDFRFYMRSWDGTVLVTSSDFNCIYKDYRMSLHRFSPKKPSEQYYIKFDCFNELQSTTIVSAVITVKDQQGHDVTATLTDSTKQSKTDKHVNIFVRNGTPGAIYKIYCVVTDSAGETFELCALLPMDDLSYTASSSNSGYCTIDNIKGIMSEQDLIQLTDDHDSGAEVIVSANVNKAISDAGEMIDGYIRARYALPLSPMPGLIATLACDIVVYRLYARRTKLTPPEGVSERYKNALKLLGQIQKGEIDLGVGVANTPEVADSSGTTSAASRIFTRHSMKGF